MWLGQRADGSALPETRAYLWEITGALSAFVVSWIPLTAVVNAPRPAGRWARFLAIHVADYVASAVLHAAIMIGARFPLYRALGWGSYDYAGGGSAAFRLAMEASKDVVICRLLTVDFGLLMAWRDGQRRALREAGSPPSCATPSSARSSARSTRTSCSTRSIRSPP